MVTGGIKSIAIDNLDATTTTVLVLGIDNVVRASGGDLTGTWPSATNLGTWTTHVQPVDTNGAAVSLKKIVSVRSQGKATTDIVGLTPSGNDALADDPERDARLGSQHLPHPDGKDRQGHLPRAA